MRTFRELTVWQQAHEFVLAVYRATAHYPSHELYGLVSQMRRSAVSITANIVEGHKRRGRKEFLNFLEIADSSLEELKYYLLLSTDLRYIIPSAVEPLYQQAERIGRMLTRLKQYIRKEVSNVSPRRLVPTNP
ncbi:MAG TPA: four helix bundle protein [Candidatus Omnitrophica bacterium]|nr:four helix bundle protein [Candidatus Omnitrophota bacterium]HBQ38685.1 four helix bundle protein [Candidatus Omnitrophota bacterium]